MSPGQACATRKAYAALPAAEVCVCVAVWTAFVPFTIYKVYRASADFQPSLLSYLKRSEYSGWLLGAKYRDASDFEWEMVVEVVKSLVPWLIVHSQSARLIKRKHRGYQLLYYALEGLLCLGVMCGPKATLLLVLHPLLSLSVAWSTRSVPIIWSTMCVLMYGFSNVEVLKQINEYFTGELSDSANFVFTITLGWTLLRCLSFCIDFIKDCKRPNGSGHGYNVLSLSKKSFGQLLLLQLAYCFYLPVVITGPVHNFDVFAKSLASAVPPLPSARSALLELRFVAIIWLKFLLDHACFTSALLRHPTWLWSEADPAAMVCVAAYNCFVFYLIYYVLYGVPKFFVELDGMQGTPYPKCVARIHIFSSFWRNFDVGLYRFMHKYIYETCQFGKRLLAERLLASVVCFGFVYLWHGTSLSIFVWTAANLIGIVVEAGAKKVAKTEQFAQVQHLYLGGVGQRRLQALLMAPSYLLSAIALQFFFVGQEVGLVFVRRLVLDVAPAEAVVAVAVAYCGANVSIECSNWEVKYAQKKPKEKIS